MELQELLRICPGFKQEHKGGAVSGPEQDAGDRTVPAEPAAPQS